ncbi:MAG: CPBP family intramembrane glutamic endopeptidase [Planctomycetota bacterium]
MTPTPPRPLASVGKPLLWIEYLLLFFVVPGGLAWWRLHPEPIADWLAGRDASPWILRLAERPGQLMMPTLALFCIGCFVFLLLDRSFARQEFWSPRKLGPELKRILAIWLPCIAGLVGLTAVLRSEYLFILPREIPLLWLMIMCLYPIFSVYPQGVIYRPFLFHRYSSIFTTPPAMIAASAIAFGWMHIVFLNWLAPLLTLGGGVLFAWTYHRTRSAFAASFEHAIYGCWIFTVGLGLYFFGGAQVGEDGELRHPREGPPSQVDTPAYDDVSTSQLSPVRPPWLRPPSDAA